MRAPLRHLAGCAVAAIAAWPLAGQALGLSAASGEAVIGESLQVEVPLTGTMDRPLDSDCISIRRVPEGLDPEYFPRDLVARVDRQSSPRILVTSRAAVRQPLVEFRVFVACGYNLFRDYLFMAAPRRESPAPAAAAAAPMPATVPASAVPAVVAAPAVAAVQRLPDGIAGRNIVLDRDMTLEELARRHFPGPLRQQRFMRWVVEANPQYFAGAGARLRQQRLSAGSALVVPDTVPPRRPGDHQGSVTPLGEKLDSANPGPTTDASPRPKAAAGGATKAAGAGAKDRLVVGGGSYARNLKETVALVDQLTGMLEKQVEAQTAYNEKIQQLEATVDGLGKQVKALETAADKREAQWQAEREAEKVEREQEAERAWWKLLAAALTGGLLGGGALLALRTFAARKNDDAIDEVPDLAAAADPEPVPAAAAAPKHAPLTQFGWDDEAPQAPPVQSPAAEPAPAPEALPAASGTKPAPAAAHHIDFELPASMTAADPESYDPANAAIELANIMTSMGLAESAAQTLVEHIRENPRESLPQWLKLMEIHRLNGNRSEFERSATEMRQHFNVQPEEWNAAAPQGRNSLEAYPHIRSQIVKLWRRPECVTLLRALLLDNREGTRIGFPLAVAEEILLLVAIHNSNK